MPMVQATDVPGSPPGGLPRAGDLPNAYQNITANAASFGSLEGAAMEQLGQTVGRAADVFAERAVDMQKIHNATVVEDNNTHYMKTVNTALFGDPNVPGDTGYYGTKGMEAAHKRHEVLARLDKAEKDITAGLQNDAQRLAFQHETRYNRRWVDRDVGSHYQREMTKASDDSAKAGFAVAAQTAGRNYNDPDRHRDGLLAADDLARREARGDPTTEQFLRGKYRDQVYTEIAHGYAAQNDWDGARKWFDANKQYISDPKVADTINQHIHDKSIDADVITRFMVPGAVAPVGGGTLFDRVVSRGERSRQDQVSPAGAVGRAQVLPATAREVAAANNIPWDENRFRTDEKYNMQLGQLHLNRLLAKYDGNEALASAAYNAGEARVDTWITDPKIGDPRTGRVSNKEFTDRIPIEETRNFVRRVGADSAVVQAQGGGTRNQPISNTLNVQLERASTAVGNLKVEVFSGGQPRSGPNRVGTHRHDEGGAGDIQLRDTMTGKLLDMRVPADRARMAKFITEAVRAGATGVGAHPDYMGPYGIHIGGGAPAVWGSDQTQNTAPSWVRAAWSEGRGASQYSPAGTPTGTPAAPAVTPAVAPAAAAPAAAVPAPVTEIPPLPPRVTIGPDGNPVFPLDATSEEIDATINHLTARGQVGTSPRLISIEPLAGSAVPAGTTVPAGDILTPPTEPVVPVYIPPVGAPPTPPATPGPAPVARNIPAEIQELRALYPNPTDFVKAYNAYSRILTMENTAAAQKHKAEQDVSEHASRGYMDRVIKGDYVGVLNDIANDDKLTLDHKRALYGSAISAQNHDTNKFPKTHGTGFYDVWRRVFAEPGDPNRITDVNQILKMVDEKNYLSVTGAKELAAQLLSKKTPEGQADSEMYDQLFKAARARLTYTGLESLGVKDDQGDALHLRFMQQALPMIVQLKKDGMPMAQITDLEKGPLKPMLDKLVRDPAVIFQQYITRMQQLQLGINPATGQKAPVPGAIIKYDKSGNPVPTAPVPGAAPAPLAPPLR